MINSFTHFSLFFVKCVPSVALLPSYWMNVEIFINRINEKLINGLVKKSASGQQTMSKIKSNEGMIFGGMYSDWKRRKGYDGETV